MAERKRAGVALDMRKADVAGAHELEPARHSDLGGRMLFDAKDYLDIAPYWALLPGMLIFLTVLSINYISDGLRDAIDLRSVLG